MNNPTGQTSLPHHGGDITGARARFGGLQEDWLDLSTGINRNPYPFTWPAARFMANLPQAEDLDQLLCVVQRYCGVQNKDGTVAAPGTQALIQLLPRLFARGSVAVLGPTYDEHAKCWRKAGHEVWTVQTLDEASNADVVVLVNPNNPTGRAFALRELCLLREHLAAKGRWLIIDEAFADTEPALSLAPQEAGKEGLLILRSFGKFFGLAGLRLGFALTIPSLAARIQDELGAWAVSGPAIEIATQAYADTPWIETTRSGLAVAAARLDRLLGDNGMHIVGGTSLFRLAASDHAMQIADTLARAHILVRRFPHEPTWLRLGIPSGTGEFARLEKALSHR